MSRVIRTKELTAATGSTSTRSGPQPSDSGPSLRRSKRTTADGGGITSSSDVINNVGGVNNATSLRVSGDASVQQQHHDNKSDYLSGTATSSKRTLPYENTYKTSPDERFMARDVETLIHATLNERLNDVAYEPVRCKCLTQELAAEIMERLKSLAFKRYKMVAVVSIGSLRERPGMQFGSRCLWNQQTDSFISVKYTNGSLFAVAMIYGLYFE